jgi:kumamolisin
MRGHALRVTPRDQRRRLTVTIVLRRTDEPGFKRYLHAVYDRSSPLHDHFLTQTQLANRFGPSLSEYDHVRSWLVAQGFRYMQGSSNRLSLSVRGTRAEAQRAFHTRIQDVRTGKRLVYGNIEAPAVPRAFAPHVQAVLGLSDLARPTSHNENVPGALSECAALFQLPQLNGTGGLIYQIVKYVKDFFLLTIADLAFIGAGSLYAYCSGLYLGAAWFGPGGLTSSARFHPGISRVGHNAAIASAQKVGLLEYDTYHLSDVSDWLKLVVSDPSVVPGITNRLSNVNVNGGVSSSGAGESEVLLDIDSVLAAASPSSNAVVYDAPINTSFVQMFQTMIGDGDTVISNSWTACEDQTPQAEVQAIDSVLASAAASGISVLNASGDYGSACADGSPNTVAVPADSPHATAVGGTSPNFGSGLAYGSESWWDDENATPAGGAGGFGVSRYFTRPSFQNGLTSSSMRSVPDLSFNANPFTGVELCQADAGGCPQGSISGGTSMSAPEVAALVADLNTALGHNIGDLNATLYPLAGAGFHSAASMGSDFAHVGLGSPNFTAVYAQLAGIQTGAVSASNSLAGGVGEPQADGSQQGLVRVELKDAKGFPVGGKTVTLTPNVGSSAVVSPSSTTTGATDGAVAFKVSDTVAEAVTFTATDTSDAVTLSTHPAMTFVAPSAAGASITGGPSTVSNNGTSKATIFIYLQNALGRPAAGKTVSISEGGGLAVITPAGASSPGTTAVTDSAGTATFTATDTSAEAVDFTAKDVSDGSLTVPGGLFVTFGPGTGSCNSTITTPVAGFSASAFVTGLAFSTENAVLPGNFTEPACSGQSPPAFDASGNAFVANPALGTINVFGPAGGVASTTNQLPNASFNGDGLSTLVFGHDGSLYASLSTPGQNVSHPEIVQVDPATGATIRIVADAAHGLPDCPFSLIVDPLSGDLFTDDDCSGFAASAQITRIANPSSASPTVTNYVADSGALGIAFAPDGTLYVDNVSACTVDRVGGTNTASPTPVAVASVPCSASQGPFGLTVAAANSAGHATALDVFSFGGTISRIDLTQTPAAVTTVGSGNSYFYIGATTANGCDYAPLPGAIERFGSGSCGTAGTAPGPQIELSSSGPSPSPTGSSVTFTAQLSNFSSAPNTPVTLVVGGANAQVKLVHADSSGQATFALQGALTGGDSLQATATDGSTAISSASLTQRWTSGKDVTYVSLNGSQESGAVGSPATLDVQLVDVSQSPATAITGASVQVSLQGRSCTAITNASGAGSCPITPPGPSGMAAVSASYAGDSTYTPSAATNFFAAGGLGLPPTMTTPTPTAPKPPAGAPKVTTVPKITGTAKAGKALSCSQGSWTNSPTAFAYLWSRDGTPIVGATHASYVVQRSDEGLTLRCAVTASNAAGAGQPATSQGVAVPVPVVKGCPRATGALSGQALGLVKLGMTRKQARRAYKHSSDRGKRYEDFFCLTPIGVRVGFASPALLKALRRSERRKLSGRVVWVSTASAYYALDGVRVGATVGAAGKLLKLGTAFQIGKNRWYLPANGNSTGVLKVRNGIVEEVGITYRQLTLSRKADLTFLKSFS